LRFFTEINLECTAIHD